MVWKRYRLLACAFVFCASLAATRPALAATYSEAAVKAAYLHRFAAYVQWPLSAVDGRPFVIGVLGADEVAAELEQLLPGLSIHDHRAVVQKITPGASLDGVRILYVGPRGSFQARELMSAAARRPILLVTDDASGLARGSVINFIRVERTVRFEVSLTAAERTGLKISSGLLSVAARVEGRPQANLLCPDSFLYGAHTCLPLLARHDSAGCSSAAKSS